MSPKEVYKECRACLCGDCEKWTEEDGVRRLKRCIQELGCLPCELCVRKGERIPTKNCVEFSDN